MEFRTESCFWSEQQKGLRKKEIPRMRKDIRNNKRLSVVEDGRVGLGGRLVFSGMKAHCIERQGER